MQPTYRGNGTPERTGSLSFLRHAVPARLAPARMFSRRQAPGRAMVLPLAIDLPAVVIPVGPTRSRRAR